MISTLSSEKVAGVVVGKGPKATTPLVGRLNWSWKTRKGEIAIGRNATIIQTMSVIELERAFEKMSAEEQEQFAEWYEGRLARAGFEPGNEEAWAVEVDRRLEEIRSGKVQGVPGEQVMAELRRRYGV